MTAMALVSLSGFVSAFDELDRFQLIYMGLFPLVCVGDDDGGDCQLIEGRALGRRMRLCGLKSGISPEATFGKLWSTWAAPLLVCNGRRIGYEPQGKRR